jgi:hypothetical protein
MAAGSLIENIDVIEDTGLGQVPCLVNALANSLLLQAAEEGFRHRIIPAIASTTHGGHLTMDMAKAAPIITAILRLRDLTFCVRMIRATLCLPLSSPVS